MRKVGQRVLTAGGLCAVSVTIPADIRDRIAEAADRERRSFSSMVAVILAGWLSDGAQSKSEPKEHIR